MTTLKIEQNCCHGFYYYRRQRSDCDCSFHLTKDFVDVDVDFDFVVVGGGRGAAVCFVVVGGGDVAGSGIADGTVVVGLGKYDASSFAAEEWGGDGRMCCSFGC